MVPKCPKGKTKKCWTGHCSLKRPSHRSFCDCSLVARLLLARSSLKRPSIRNYCVCSHKRPSISSVKNVTGSNPFSPKIPNFDLPNVQTCSECCLQVLILQKALKVTQNLKSKHHFNIIQQSNQVSPKLSTTTTIHITNSQLWTPNVSFHQQHIPQQQQQHLIIHNLITTTSLFINFVRTPNIYIYIYNSSMQIQHQQHNYHSIHILRHDIKIKHEFLQLNSNNHLFK